MFVWGWEKERGVFTLASAQLRNGKSFSFLFSKAKKKNVSTLFTVNIFSGDFPGPVRGGDLRFLIGQSSHRLFWFSLGLLFL